MNANLMRLVCAGLVLAALTVMTTSSASAQCATCPTAAVAYQPVVAQPTVAYQPYTGWYPGKFFDRMRLSRYGVATTALPTYTAGYAPYTTAYAPYTANYQQAYVTSYAPLATTVVARPVVQTSYYAASPCSSCAQTVARPVMLSPVASACCSTCQVDPCGCSSGSACSSCGAGVSQAAFAEPACSSCAGSAATPSYSTPSLVPSYPSGGATVGPATPQPQLSPSEPVPNQSNYSPPAAIEGQGAQDSGEQGNVDPIPAADADSSDTSTSFEAPKLFDPRDRTAQHPGSNQPTVDVRNAVYRGSTSETLSATSYGPTTIQAEIDAEGWYSVPRGR